MTCIITTKEYAFLYCVKHPMFPELYQYFLIPTNLWIFMVEQTHLIFPHFIFCSCLFPNFIYLHVSSAVPRLDIRSVRIYFFLCHRQVAGLESVMIVTVSIICNVRKWDVLATFQIVYSKIDSLNVNGT